jgi:hypothetical protein
MIMGGTPGYLDNEVRQALWRAGHAHAGVLLILELVALRYVDETALRGGWLWLARHGIPSAAILMPAGFFASVLDAAATAPNALIGLVYAGGVLLMASVLTLGIGLLRAPAGMAEVGVGPMSFDVGSVLVGDYIRRWPRPSGERQIARRPRRRST